MSGKKCRGLRGFASGGIVDVPGASRSGVADDIHVDDAPVGGFVLPADSVQALRREQPELLAQILAATQQTGGDADGAATAQIAISNGELFIPPEAVALLGGAQVLNAIKDATHQPVSAPAAKPLDAPPPPGGVNAPLDAVVQPPRGLPLGMAGAVLPDAAMPGSAQAQQQRTFFKGGGLVRRAFPNGGVNEDDPEKPQASAAEKATNNVYGDLTGFSEKAAQPLRAAGKGMFPYGTGEPGENDTQMYDDFATDQAKQHAQFNRVREGEEPMSFPRFFAGNIGHTVNRLIAPFFEGTAERAAKQSGSASPLVALNNSITEPTHVAMGQRGAMAQAGGEALPAGMRQVEGAAGVITDGKGNYTNVRSGNGAAVWAADKHTPATAGQSGQAGMPAMPAAPTSRAAVGSPGWAGTVSDATRAAYNEAAKAAILRREDPFAPRGLSISMPSAAPLRTPQQERMYNDALAALHEKATTPLRRQNGALGITARQRAEKDAAAEKLAGLFQQDANRQQAAQANTVNAQVRAAEIAARQREAQQPRGLPSALDMAKLQGQQLSNAKASAELQRYLQGGEGGKASLADLANFAIKGQGADGSDVLLDKRNGMQIGRVYTDPKTGQSRRYTLTGWEPVTDSGKG